MSRTFIIVVVVVALFIAISAYEDQNDSTDSTDSTDSSGDGTMSTIDALYNAIVHQEQVPAFHNNPAALTAGAANEVGADYTPNTTGGLVVNFDTLEDGIEAGKAFIAQFVADHSDLTLIQALATYINGPNAQSTITGAATGNYPTNVATYASGVAKALGTSITATLASIFGGGS